MNLKEAGPKFKAIYKGVKNVIIYYDKDYKRLFIELKDIDKIKIEIIEPNVGITLLIIAGSIVLFFALILGIIFLSDGIKM